MADKKDKAAQRENRFNAIFGKVTFKHEAQRGEPLQLRGGGTQTRLAQAIIEIASTGLIITSAYICRRDMPIGNGKMRTVFLLQMPSSGGQFKRPIFDTDDEACKLDFVAWQSAVVAEWQKWRKAAVASGAPLVNTTQNVVPGVEVDADDLKDLGLE